MNDKRPKSYFSLKEFWIMTSIPIHDMFVKLHFAF